MKGRKPKPIALRVLQGNAGKRPIPTNVPQPRTHRLRCPDHLQGEAQREWRRMVKELDDMGVLARVDRPALELYCVIYARWRQAEARLAEIGDPVVVLINGYEALSGYLVIANRCIVQMKALLTEFGATPSSRARVRIERPSEELSLAEKLRRAVNE